MNTDEARKISEEIHRRIYWEERERRGSDGDQPRSREPLTRGIRPPETSIRGEEDNNQTTNLRATDVQRGSDAVGGGYFIKYTSPHNSR